MEAHTHSVREGETGFVTEAKGYLLNLEGLPSVHVNDVIVNTRGQRALVTALKTETVEALLLDRNDPEVGDRFMLHTQGIKFSFGEHLFGRIINTLGDPLDGKEGSMPPQNNSLKIEVRAPGMSSRLAMTEQLMTGMATIDVLLPIAKGQRQLVIGPISSGKTTFLESVIAHQKGSPMVCIYAFIGRPVAYVEDTVSRILSEKGNKNAIILASFSDEPAPMIYLTPTVALGLAEFFSSKGSDVLLVLDDLGSHAKYLREIALLSGRIPGRESYPGDMFYQHAHLLERAGYFNKNIGGGSITILPILETNIEDITNLVSTNLMSATDGHLFFSPLLHSEGHFPAVLTGQSVTRVGRQTQSNLAKQLSIRVQALLAEYERQRGYSQFGTQLSESTRHIITQGEFMQVFLRQEPLDSVPLEVQIILLSLVFTALFNNRDIAFAERNYGALIKVTGTSKAIQPVVESARRGTISLDQFFKKVESVLPYFEAVCQQQ